MDQETTQRYERKKAHLTAEFRDALAEGASIGLGKRTSNLFRNRQQAKRLIDVADFNRVLSIDATSMLAEVEGMLTFDDFTRQTLRHGLLPAVVPELKSITVGGAMAGVAIESSSFKYGLVHETVTAMEVLTGDGTVISCARTGAHRDLFFGFPNSYGTLGYALKLTVQLVRAKEYVELRHEKFSDAGEYFEAFRKACLNKGLDFVDGTVFDTHELYLTTARFVATAPFVSNYTYLQIYYRSIRKTQLDYLSVYDYIWRWDTDWFWCSKNFGLQNLLLRALARPWLCSTAYWQVMRWNRKHQFTEKLLKLLGSQRQDESVIQDVQIPVQGAAQFLALLQEHIGIKPVWICPTTPAQPERYPTYPMEFGQMYLNFGFWDVVPLPAGQKEGFFNRQVERWTERLNGHKSLYSSVFYDEETFWQQYGGTNYRLLKQKYDPNGRLRDLYAKAVRHQ